MQDTVVDANVFVSIILDEFISRFFGEAFWKREFHIVYSLKLLDELTEVLLRKEFAFSRSDILKIIGFIKNTGQIVFPSETINICRDSKDNALLKCAVAGNADFIVTGDKDLLALSPFRGIHIVTPSRFLVVLRHI